MCLRLSPSCPPPVHGRPTLKKTPSIQGMQSQHKSLLGTPSTAWEQCSRTRALLQTCLSRCANVLAGSTVFEAGACLAVRHPRGPGLRLAFLVLSVAVSPKKYSQQHIL